VAVRPVNLSISGHRTETFQGVAMPEQFRSQCAKAWFIDRTVLLFEDMKKSNSEYADWEY
jgi:hypothetical protein